jgi:putative flavoprotein involved in K+ transport
MTTQHIETLIIGAGQAGLSTGYHLKQRGREFLIVDGNDRIGDNWRCHYDSLRLFTPAWLNGLDGLDFPAEDRWHFPTKDEFADYLELYAFTSDLPVRMQTRVQRLSQSPDGGYLVDLGGDQIACDNVVLAVGSFGRMPVVPPFADDLDPRIRQLHSADYHSPEQLLDGPTLVVGASHSGLDIAYELAASRPVTMVGPSRGVIPVEWGTRLWKLGMPVIGFAFQHVLTRRTRLGRTVMGQTRHHGAPQLRVKERHLVERGAEWVQEHVAGVDTDGRPALADERAFDVANVIWCTGFRHDWSWVDLPVPMADGWPVEYRGVVEEIPGLFYCGMWFQYAFSSGEVHGVGRDAAYLAKQIVARAAAKAPVAA